jgi:hypothetical protein
MSSTPTRTSVTVLIESPSKKSAIKKAVKNFDKCKMKYKYKLAAKQLQQKYNWEVEPKELKSKRKQYDNDTVEILASEVLDGLIEANEKQPKRFVAVLTRMSQ